MNDQDRLEELLGDFYAHEDRETPEEFIARHPEHAELLREHFALNDLVEHAFVPRPALPETLGPFRIEKELGSGGMGTVYRAVVAEPLRGIATGKTVALKVVHPHLFRTQGFFKRFLREAELGQRIDHPNVVRTLDADAVEIDDRPQHYLVMEYVEGQTLRDLMDDVDLVPEALARHVGCEVAKALSAIHAAGAVHRDLKPENVLITPDHEIKVMDLGVARLADEAVRLSQTGAFVGSLHYAAPEQFGGGQDIDARADLHGLGVLLYEISTGTNPYADEDVRVVMRRILQEEPRKAGELNPQLSPFFEELLVQLLAKDPSARFDNAGDVLSILDDAEKSTWWRSRAKEIRATSQRPLRRIRIPRETAVYGRDTELSRLRTFYDAAKEGDGRVVLVEGEAGIGKTRLVDEFVSRLQQDGDDVNFLFASYPPGGAATASGAFAQAFREHLGDERLDEAVAERLPQTPLLAPAFAALLRGGAAPVGAEALTKGSLQTCFAQVTRDVARERTTILLIDDLHFAPDEGRALFTSLALAIPGHRVLLIGTMRPGVPEDWIAEVTRLDQSSQLSVPRLGPKDLVRLLGDSFKSQRLAEELAGKIAVKSDGNPFFAFEIIRGLREGQFITQGEDGTWASTRLIEDIQVPSSVLDLVNARVADLDDDDRNLLDLASCWGYEFDPSLIVDALGLPRLPTLQRLARIEKRDRLVRSIGRNYAFDHHQVQEALYGALNEQLGEEYHAALAEALEARTSARSSEPSALPGDVLIDMTDQFLRSSRPEGSTRYLATALERLADGYAHARAADMAERARSTPGLVDGEQRVQLLLTLAASLDHVGRRELVSDVLGEALEFAQRLTDADLLAEVLVALGDLASKKGEFDDARTHYEQALQRSEAAGRAECSLRALAGLGVVHRMRGELDAALELTTRQIDRAREIGDRANEAGAIVNRGNVFCEQGRLDDAIAAYERGLEIARAIGHRAFEANALCNRGVVHLYRGELGEAERCFRADAELCRATGNRPGEATALGNLSMVLRDLGKDREMRETSSHSIAMMREVGDAHGVAVQQLTQAKLELTEGDAQDATVLAEDALDAAIQMNAAGLEANANGILGDIAAHRGRLAEAHRHHSRYVELTVERSLHQEEAGARGVLGDDLHSLGQLEAARAELELNLSLLREQQKLAGRGRALISLGMLALEQDDIEGARRLCGEALDAARSDRSPADEASALLARARVSDLEGDVESGLADLTRGHELARESGSTALEVLGACHLARHGRLSIDEAESLLRRNESVLSLRSRIEAHFALGRASQRAEHIREAGRLLGEIVDHAPPEFRESVVSHVRLHRDVHTATSAITRDP